MSYCWYIFGEKCERHGVCEGCPQYDRFVQERINYEIEIRCDGTSGKNIRCDGTGE